MVLYKQKLNAKIWKRGGEKWFIEHFAEDYPLIMGIVDLVPVIY